MFTLKGDFLALRSNIILAQVKDFAGEMDEEMLSLTAALLERNPDFYTFWNIRREVIGLLSQVCCIQ